MDQEIRSTGSIITGVILIIAGLFCVMLGAGIIAAYPDKVWPIGVVLLACAGFIFYGAIKKIRSSEREKREALEASLKVQQITGQNWNKPIGTSTALPVLKDQPVTSHSGSTPAILACWGYTIADWKTFMQHETKKQQLNILVVSVVLFFLGTTLLVLSGDAGIPGGIALSLIIGIVYGVIKYRLHISSIRHNGPGNPQVVIMLQALIINGHYNSLTGDSLWFEKAEIKNEQGFTILEITYGWHTRNGNTNDEIRVPVPAGKETEAEQIVSSFYAYYRTS